MAGQESKETPIAYELAKRQKEISVAEFFTKNRHLLGFDNKRKALLMAVKEAVDNSLDACEEARVLPEISVEIIQMAEFKYKVVIEDNGPGIVKKQIPNIFAKLLYGSKFHTLKQARGQQGIGISAAVLYGQLTTGRPVKITSRVSSKEPALYFELNIDTQNNKPVIAKEETIEWAKDHGTKVEIDLEAEYLKGNQSVDEYLKQTAVINPHVTIIYTNPKSEQVICKSHRQPSFRAERNQAASLWSGAWNAYGQAKVDRIKDASKFSHNRIFKGWPGHCKRNL